MKRYLKYSFIALPWVILAALAFYLTVLDGWRDNRAESIHDAAYGIFDRNADVTEARIFLLQGEEGSATDQTFSVPLKKKDLKVYGSITLTGEKLKAFLRSWTNMGMDLSIHAQSLCHHPPYGFQLLKGNSIIAETSICWACSNFYVTTQKGSSWYGFHSAGSASQSLLMFCDALLPYPKEVVKEITPHPETNDIALAILEYRFKEIEERYAGLDEDDNKTKIHGPHYLMVYGKDPDNSLINAVESKQHPVLKGTFYIPEPRRFETFLEKLKYNETDPSSLFKVTKIKAIKNKVKVGCSIFLSRGNEVGREYILEKRAGTWNVLSVKNGWMN